MKKTLITLTALFAASAASADNAEDALLNAQSAYRTALKAQNGNDGRIISLQTDLADAQRRAQKAQADIDRLQKELASAMSFKNEQASTLQQAGQRLDAAWQAVYGPGGTKAAR